MVRFLKENKIVLISGDERNHAFHWRKRSNMKGLSWEDGNWV